MASVSTWMLSLKVVLISAGVLVIALGLKLSKSSKNEQMEEQTQMQQTISKISTDQQPAVRFDMKYGSEFGVVETTVLEAETNVLVLDDGGEFEISKSEWIPPRRIYLPEIPSRVVSPMAKPPATSRFGHRKPVKASPESNFTNFGKDVGAFGGICSS